MSLNILKSIISTSRNAATKNIIRNTLGKNLAIARPFEDCGDFYSFCKILKKSPTHYAAFEGKSITGLSFGERYTHHIGLNYDESNALQKLRVFDVRTKDVTIYDNLGNVLKHYTPTETTAIQTYKRDSSKIHKILRHNKPVKNESEVREKMETISKLFNSESKVNIAQEDMITYRALDSKALKEILSMPEDGMIYTEPSFLSVATKKSSTYQFMNLKNFRHILKLKVPKDAKYLNLDEISAGRIVQPQVSENELLFKNGCKIRIINRHAKGGYIEAELIT